MAHRAQIAFAIGASAVLHVAVMAAAPDGPPPPGPAPARSETARPGPTGPVRVAARKDPPPRPAPEPAPVRPVADPPPAPRRTPDPARQRPSASAVAPVPPAPTPEAPAPRRPAPLVLSTVALNGGVAVQVGAVSNPAGSGAVDATGWTPSPAAPAAAGSPEGAGAGPARVVVSPPALVADAKGQYPSEHRDLGRVVRVDLMIRIDPRGEVRGASVTRGDRPAFDDEARRTVARLRFRPATRDGSPIPWEMKWTVVFLPEGAS